MPVGIKPRRRAARDAQRAPLGTGPEGAEEATRKTAEGAL